MKLTLKERALTAPMVILASLIVIVLGVLQYRWSNQVSEATSIRLADSLQMSMVNWHLDFFRDFSEICLTMNVDSESEVQFDETQYARRFAEWKRLAAYPGLVADLYIVSTDDPADSRVLRLNQAAKHFEAVAAKPAILSLSRQLRTASKAGATESSAAQQPSDLPQSLGSAGPTPNFSERFYTSLPLAGWRFETTLPALVHAIAPESRQNKSDLQARERPGVARWIVVELNGADIRTRILPDLSQRYFRGTTGLDYQVAVIGGNKPGQLIYSSDSGFGELDVRDADGTMDIFGTMQDVAPLSPIQIFHSPSNTGPAQSMGVSWFPLLDDPTSAQDWKLVVRHRRGGALGAFVADSRRRDLALSFGVLLLLVISMAILIITSTRAQRLAKVQMDFVTAVSHELRTPLTVIGSAAENIAHGVIEGRQQVAEYGTIIGVQARKLFELVEQILLFASIREGHQRYTTRTLQVAEIIDAALNGTAELVQEAKFMIEKEVEPNLPQVAGDLSALSRCLQNLITNALKYGRDQRWIGLQARLVEHGGLGSSEIQISVEDRGIGIGSADMPHIFDPFYRSPSVTAAQIHGTGLGLPLAKSIAEAMRGRLTVKSAPGRGSTFTLHLPSLQVSNAPASRGPTHVATS